METLSIFQDLGISLLLGLLVGIQREHVDAPLGGVRTFPLVTLLGTICALLAHEYGGWILAAGFLGVIITVAIGKFVKHKEGHGRAGLTTAVALMLMYAVGAYVVAGDWSIAVAVVGTVAIILQLKLELHGIVAKLGDTDIKAIMQFVLISFIILPVLPNQTYDWYNVLNPREIWLMVVLVVGISLGGYVLWKFFGQQAGIVLGGILGGTISSTATTVSFAKRSRFTPTSARSAATVIMIATAISLIRVLIEMVIVDQNFLRDAIIPMSSLTAVAAILCLIVWAGSRNSKETLPQQENPTELKSAMIFGMLYALVLFAVAAAKEHFEQSGLYVVAILSGLTDMDAITLSTSRLVSDDRLSATTGWNVIVLAFIANLVFKAILIALLGDRKLLKRIVIFFSIMMLTGIILIASSP